MTMKLDADQMLKFVLGSVEVSEVSWMLADQGYRIAKYPTEGACVGLTVDEAREIAREDRGLIYVATTNPKRAEAEGAEDGASAAREIADSDYAETGLAEGADWGAACSTSLTQRAHIRLADKVIREAYADAFERAARKTAREIRQSA